MNSDYLQLARDRLVNSLSSKKLNQQEITAIAALLLKLDRCAIQIAAFGMVSCGKTSVLNALLGKKLWATGAIHGVTQTVETKGWNPKLEKEIEDTSSQDSVSFGAENEEGNGSSSISSPNTKVQIELIDTPGIDEIAGEERTVLAMEAAQKADLILFVIAGDMTRIEQDAIAKLRECYKPILLVFNKIDLYPESDRLAIHAALQSEAVRQLISPDEIVLSSAEPMPTKVRLQYADRPSQDVWEQSPPDVESLKLRILSLLNQEGKALLALNAMRALADIQTSVTQRHLQRLPSLRPTVTAVFIGKAIALFISPWFWLDGLISGAIDSLLLAVWIWGFPLQQSLNWLGAIALNSLILGGLGIAIGSDLGWNFSFSSNFGSFSGANFGLSDIPQFAQIGWTGITLPWMLRSLHRDLEQSSGWGRSGAKALIQKILQTAPTNTILSRLKSN
ncbi:Era-like GTP-binding protein [Tumidithrix helvetica PCC 7403]|uniref:Era-like GTP-binding protein n=1 Tax=Tumidithrix helvetica TaxID=3457545 RepID=UPI003CB9C446